MESLAHQRLVYFILGTPGTGRREIVRDLLENGRESGERALVLLPESDIVNSAEAAMTALENVQLRRWTWTENGFPSVPRSDERSIFFLSDAKADPITQIEALKPWLQENGVELARILCLVDCQLAEKNPFRDKTDPGLGRDCALEANLITDFLA